MSVYELVDEVVFYNANNTPQNIEMSENQCLVGQFSLIQIATIIFEIEN